jgi:recombination protein RecA
MPKKKKEEIKPEDQLQKILEEIRGRFGEGSIMRLDETRASDVAAIPTGSLAIDLALGVGGIPRGRVIEIFGAESTGKTTLALHIISEAQKQGGNAAFIDAEHALDPDYAEKIGVNIKELIIAQPGSGEEALQIVEKLVRSREIDVIVIDSVAALTPRAEIEGEVGDLQIGLQARLMSQACRKLSSIVANTKTSVIFLNQTRMKIGIRFGSPETTPGGLALKFYSSVRINLQRRATIKSGDEIIGSRMMLKVVKNKVAPPFRGTEFDIYYSRGISKNADLISLGLKHDVLKLVGSWYKYGEEKLGQGMQNSEEYLNQNPKIAAAIKKEILSAVNS